MAGPLNHVNRLRDPRGKFGQVFETEVGGYWERIKEKILELQAERMAHKKKRFDELKAAGAKVPEKFQDLATDDEDEGEADAEDE